jgi:hypothetical protein
MCNVCPKLLCQLLLKPLVQLLMAVLLLLTSCP